MGKHEDIAAIVAAIEHPINSPFHPCYHEFFRLFNTQRYYESHDILEHIWLESAGDQYTFYKALIQFAGAFVHLQLHHYAPTHPTHSRRLHPAARLFARSADLLSGFPDLHEGISTRAVRILAESTAQTIRDSNFQSNPWSPGNAPQLMLPKV